MRKEAKKAFRNAFLTVWRKAGHDEGDMPPINVEIPREEKFGDFSATAAMALTTSLKIPPRKIAEAALKNIKDNPLFESSSIAGPGYINVTLNRATVREEFAKIPDDSSDYGSLKRERSEKLLIEFVSANPTGPLHIGHGRGAAFGDVLARVLRKAGYDVTREYYVNDAGLQMENLGLSTLARYKELHGRTVEFPKNGYHGDYIKEIAQEIKESEGDVYLDRPIEEALPFFTKQTADKILGGIKSDLETFRVTFDNWVSETVFHETGKVEHALEHLKKSGEIFEKDGALWLRTSGAGDEKDRVVKRSNGATTYFAADIAYHDDKYERGYTRHINIWGADHHGYVARLKAAVAALGKEPDSLQPLLIQLVHLKRGGEAVAMSTRAGEFETLKEVVDEVGVDAARFFFLTRSHESHLEFDLELAKKQSSENPVYYVQYGHARISNIFKTASGRGIVGIPKDVDWDRLELDEEIKIMKKALSFPDLVDDCANSLAPHSITHYLMELAGMFHRYYNVHRVVSDDAETTKARLAFTARLRTVLKNGLELLGVSAPDRM
ncbi:MAG: arginine--tRNA ligase [Nitrospinota bacterium]